MRNPIRQAFLFVLIKFIFCSTLLYSQEKLIYETTIFQQQNADRSFMGEKLIVYNDGTIERYFKYFVEERYPYCYHCPDKDDSTLAKVSQITQLDLDELDEFIIEHSELYREIPPTEEGNIFAPKVKHSVTWFKSEEYSETFIFYDHMLEKYSPELKEFLDDFRERLYSLIREFVPHYIL